MVLMDKRYELIETGLDGLKKSKTTKLKNVCGHKTIILDEL